MVNAKIVVFRKMGPFLRGQEVRGGWCGQKIFWPKFAQRNVLGTCEVWGALWKAVFRQFKIQSKGGAAPPPRYRRTVNPRTKGCDKKRRQENEKSFNLLSCRAEGSCHRKGMSALGDKTLLHLRQEKSDTTSGWNFLSLSCIRTYFWNCLSCRARQDKNSCL